MKIKSIVVSVAAVAVLLAYLAQAPLYGGQARDDYTQAMVVATFGLMSPRLLNALNLTPDQAAKIAASKEAFRHAQKAYLDEILPLRKDVADRLFGPNPVKEADVAAQIAKIADLREKILRDGFRIALEVRQTLRPDQLAKAASIRQQLLEIQSEVRELYEGK